MLVQGERSPKGGRSFCYAWSMTKSLLIQIDNANGGEVELWASQPMANGTAQTAPVFVTSKTYTSGQITLTGLQETPTSKSWHYRLFVRPWGKVGGSAQYRFYLPASAPATANLTSLESAW